MPENGEFPGKTASESNIPEFETITFTLLFTLLRFLKELLISSF
jgi:hypothetical protein